MPAPLSPVSCQQAQRDMARRVRRAKTSFASGMRVLPKARREAMYALYAFCREVDDIADDSPTAQAREEGLALWRGRIARLFQNSKAEESITTALLPAIKAYGLVEADFQAVIDGMAMDAREAIVAPSLSALDAYCDHVASAVGRASVRIFGDASVSAMHVAYHLGRALQLTNILRDLAEDAARGRLYLPDEALKDAGITMREPMAVIADPRLPAACRFLAARARNHFDETDKALALCDSRAMRPARVMRDYYRALLVALVESGWKLPIKRLKLSFGRKLLLALRALMG